MMITIKNRVITTLAIIGLFGSILVGAMPVFASSASEDYQTGRDDACAGNVVPGPHTSGYERGYTDGRAACFGGMPGNMGSSSIQQPVQTNEPSSSNTNGPASVTSGDTPWQEFGVFLGPMVQKHTGVFHNENGVF